MWGDRVNMIYSRSLVSLRTTTAAAALVFALGSPAHAQEQEDTAGAPATVQQQGTQVQPALNGEDDPYADDAEAIIVTGVRRGSVIGDIPPENVLGSRDIRATGATSITELLEALEPQIGSARGRGGERPILLLNGRRISSFREMRDIPPEAIERVEILPEEVALKYGYRADQRVVNMVLRERFRSTVARVEGSTATEGGYLGGEAEATRLMISRDARTTFNFRAEGNSALTEDERDIDLDSTPDDRSARTLVGSRSLLRGSTTVNRTILTDVSATLNAEAELSQGRSLIGLSDFALDPLVRNSATDSGHVGFVLNGFVFVLIGLEPGGSGRGSGMCPRSPAAWTFPSTS